MRYGKAAVLVKTATIETWEVPVMPPEPGGILVQVVVGGVCGSDEHIASGAAGQMPFPVVLGHEGVGRIDTLGSGVTTDYAGVPINVGDLVYWSPIALCHRCHSCTVLDETPCDNSSFFEDASKPNWGSYADYAWLPNGMAFYRLPEGADVDAIAALGCALPTVLRGFEQCGPVSYTDSVVIQGAGPVGMAAVMVAQLCGARQIIVLDHSPQRLAVARSFGATATLALGELSSEERLGQVSELCGPQGASVVVEAAGALAAFPEGVNLTGKHGRYIILGLWGAIGNAAIAPRDITIRNMRVAGATFPKPKHYYQAMHLAARMQERLPLAALIGQRYAIKDAAQALASIKGGQTLKAVIDPSL
ncbi:MULTISPECIES: zinc-binding dehydrogenase [Pseudomonas]|uniref:CamD, hydroxycamphor dehydrogenase n=1 Tax=Pseudomonas monteilii TaxID=76759 RepID=A0AAE6RE60_9PSED|nr:MULTISPECIES: zinc-binding dehydrogenase [Pseudomonas]MDH4549890.1 alcohol dehydrogenase [Pseudomonas sp. BN607]QHB28801.1 CamD, hydroxycamphor dehydrogenase [Pseudomonas monteilii]